MNPFAHSFERRFCLHALDRSLDGNDLVSIIEPAIGALRFPSPVASPLNRRICSHDGGGGKDQTRQHLYSPASFAFHPVLLALRITSIAPVVYDAAHSE